MKVVAEVDVDLGLTRVVWIGAAQDVGKAINPQAAEGQVEGGTAQGLGLALMEEIQTRDGLITNASFTDYLIPTALDMPPVQTVLIEVPEPEAPYGAKGIGEPPTVVRPPRSLGAARRDRPRARPRAGAAGRHRALEDRARPLRSPPRRDLRLRARARPPRRSRRRRSRRAPRTPTGSRSSALPAARRRPGARCGNGWRRSSRRPRRRRRRRSAATCSSGPTRARPRGRRRRRARRSRPG